MKSAGIIEIYTLERQGCTAADWSTVYLDDNCDLSRIRDCRFSGRVEIGAIAELRSAAIEDCRMNSGVSIVNVRGHLRGLRIGRGVVIADVGTIESEPEASYGIGTEVAVLDETGSRPVHLYPGLSAQLATLMAMHPRWAEEHLLPRLQEKYASRPFPYDLSDGCRVVGCQLLQNVHVGKEVSIEGAKRLVNGAVINNAAPGKGLAGVGADVDAENFLIEDGYAGRGALLRNVYVGQGASLDKGFTAHDSLFFANSAMENGEACAVLAGPYSVSMHKSTLLIGMRTAFFNAGSATNFSNHMYKLGPVHWGTMLRGAKTASGAYVMWGAQIGAFSLVMGPHKYHPDTSMFPFAYLFGDAHGHTLAAPGLMLRSCGLGRDEKKWPIRDRRLRRRLPLHDHVLLRRPQPRHRAGHAPRPAAATRPGPRRARLPRPRAPRRRGHEANRRPTRTPHVLPGHNLLPLLPHPYRRIPPCRPEPRPRRLVRPLRPDNPHRRHRQHPHSRPGP